jgi:hypothetical protein
MAAVGSRREGGISDCFLYVLVLHRRGRHVLFRGGCSFLR